MTDLDKLPEQLDAMCFKIGQEGLDYFLNNYIDMVPDEMPPESDVSLLTHARNARIAIRQFEYHARNMCDIYDIEYEQ